ncbi:hypothetical protein QOT17_008981 [Balamuthia mandrillaris]
MLSVDAFGELEGDPPPNFLFGLFGEASSGTSGGSGEEEEDCTTKFFPCSDTISGNLFLVLVYSLILAFGSKLIARGSDVLMEVVDAGVIGGLLLPLLGALPDAAVVFVSGLGGDLDKVQEKLSVGIGTMAGSDVLLLTVPWILGVLFGRCDLRKRDNTAKPRTCTGFSFFRQGVTVYPNVQRMAIWMMVTLIPLCIIELAYIYLTAKGKSMKNQKWWALASLIVCVIIIILYCIYTLYDNKLHKKRMRDARRNARVQRFVKQLAGSIERQKQLEKERQRKEDQVLWRRDANLRSRSSSSLAGVDIGENEEAMPLITSPTHPRTEGLEVTFNAMDLKGAGDINPKHPQVSTSFLRRPLEDLRAQRMNKKSQLAYSTGGIPRHLLNNKRKARRSVEEEGRGRRKSSAAANAAALRRRGSATANLPASSYSDAQQRKIMLMMRRKEREEGEKEETEEGEGEGNEMRGNERRRRQPLSKSKSVASIVSKRNQGADLLARTEEERRKREQSVDEIEEDRSKEPDQEEKQEEEWIGAETPTTDLSSTSASPFQFRYGVVGSNKKQDEPEEEEEEEEEEDEVEYNNNDEGYIYYSDEDDEYDEERLNNSYAEWTLSARRRGSLVNQPKEEEDEDEDYEDDDDEEEEQQQTKNDEHSKDDIESIRKSTPPLDAMFPEPHQMVVDVSLDISNDASMVYHQKPEKRRSKLHQVAYQKFISLSDSKWKIGGTGVLLLLIGAGLVLGFADPLVESISVLAKKVNLNAFYIAFVCAPVAGNAAEIFASVLFSKRKTMKTISMMHSALYGAVVLNNTLALGVFLLMITYRGLVWNFSAEIVCIAVTLVGVGAIALFNRTIRVIWVIPVALFYPLSIGLVVFLESDVVGWE